MDPALPMAVIVELELLIRHMRTDPGRFALLNLF